MAVSRMASLAMRAEVEWGMVNMARVCLCFFSWGFSGDGLGWGAVSTSLAWLRSDVSGEACFLVKEARSDKYGSPLFNECRREEMGLIDGANSNDDDVLDEIKSDRRVAAIVSLKRLRVIIVEQLTLSRRRPEMRSSREIVFGR